MKGFLLFDEMNCIYLTTTVQKHTIDIVSALQMAMHPTLVYTLWIATCSSTSGRKLPLRFKVLKGEKKMSRFSIHHRPGNPRPYLQINKDTEPQFLPQVLCTYFCIFHRNVFCCMESVGFTYLPTRELS